MSDKYFSHRRTIVIPFVEAETVLSPADMNIGTLSGSSVAHDPFLPINPNTNMVIHGIGLFCNFADGLVYKSPFGGGMELALDVVGGMEIPFVGTSIDTTFNTETVDGVGTDFGGVSCPIGTILSIGSGRNLLMYDWNNNAEAYFNPWPTKTETIVAANIKSYDPTLTDGDRIYNITQLNYMYNAKSFVNCLAFGQAIDKYFFVASLPLLSADVLERTFWMTKSIDTSFNNELALFEAHIDVEYTPLVSAT